MRNEALRKRCASLRNVTELLPGFVQTLESPGIKMLRFPGLDSPG